MLDRKNKHDRAVVSFFPSRQTKKFKEISAKQGNVFRTQNNGQTVAGHMTV